jgi:hypothetical protein
MKTLMIVAVAVLLAGCSSMSPQGRAELAALDESTCTGYGFKRGTDNYAICMMRLDQSRDSAARDRRSRSGDALIRMGNQLLNPPSITCTTTGTAFVYGHSTTRCQ